MGRLSGKVAFITGAAGGIGQEMCRRYLEEGAQIYATDLNQEALDAMLARLGAGENGVAEACDITDSASVQAALGRAAARFGKITTLCNVAGGSSAQDARVTDAPEEEFWRVIKLDLFGTFLICKYGIPYLQKAGGGSVINFASMVSKMALTDRDCYTAAKGGVHAMTRPMAVEYAPDNIRVNAIAPGLVLTPRLEGLIPQREELQRLADIHLLGPCRPDDIAEMAVYLAADESKRVTGQILSVDSGITAL